MSASLVGSEMCIRDRWTRTSGQQQDSTLCARLEAFLVEERSLAPPLHSCLLYTSDAADDM
eukprot:11667841-Alexandrium_andersonii.AAC.1